ncbi:hypothetical protein B0H63DRAFT_454565 [Podospora didyma]|uniref:Ubiquitin 3 binding protein But2 C-terminal domain-containing protein n=1 Tax=Podospora didyma TaxID=330526 RepID=A0AAE0K652_9PEZI|nr:hypothetical protein B0H63DRAFT_454565 [Podospora didyma]
MIANTVLVPFLCAAGTALAAPAPVLDSATYCRRDPANPQGCLAFDIQPSAVVLHDTHWSGQNTCNPPAGCHVAKATTNNGHDITTMLTFTYPPAVQGRQCWLAFNLPTGATVSPATGAQVDVFKQWQPVSGCPSQGNNRDVHLGRMNVPSVAGGVGTWAATYNAHLTAAGPCPAPGTVEGIEIVGVGDNEDVAWQQGAGVGVKIVYS